MKPLPAPPPSGISVNHIVALRNNLMRSNGCRWVLSQICYDTRTKAHAKSFYVLGLGSNLYDGCLYRFFGDSFGRSNDR